MNTKLIEIFDEYRKLLKSKNTVTRIVTRAGKSFGRTKPMYPKQSSKIKRKILDFYCQSGRWPKRQSGSKHERKLGTSLENYLSKESTAFDPELRKIVMATGRKSNNKRKHNIKGFKEEIVNFVKEYGRVPTTYGGQTIEGEGRLRCKLDHYTKKSKDMSLLGEVYSLDKCHRSGILMKYRPLINATVITEKPFIRLNNTELVK